MEPTRRAQEELWNRYFQRLVALAKTKLDGINKGLGDEEDVALSAFNSFFEGAPAGEFPRLTDRTNLWPLLATITVRKAINLRHKANAEKRGGGKVYGEGGLENPSGGPVGIQHVLGREPTPQLVAELSEMCTRLLNSLPGGLKDNSSIPTARSFGPRNLAKNRSFQAKRGAKVEHYSQGMG